MHPSTRSRHATLPVAAAVALAALITAQSASAAPFTGVVVERIGGDANFNGYATGSIPANLSAAPVFLDEFTGPAAAPTQTLALPTADNGSQKAVTEYYDNDNNNGYLNLSADGATLLTTGYDSAPGTASVIAANPRRPLATVDVATGALDTSTTYRWSSAAANRSVASPGGANYYIVTDSSAQGIRFTSGTGTIPQQTPAASSGRIALNANRTTRIYDGKLFMSSGSVNVGPGLAIIDPNDPSLPTASTANASDPNTNFAFSFTPFATTTGGNPEQFVLLDLTPQGFAGTNLDTAYVADANSAASTGGLQKWTYDGSAWTLQYTLNSAGGLLGLDSGGLDPNGNPVLYATTVGNGAAGNALLAITDTGAASAFTTLATSPANTYFRGVATLSPIPIPEPTTLALLALAPLTLLPRPRRQP